jgi:hypothetical protein
MLTRHRRGFVFLARLDLDAANECVYQVSFDCSGDSFASTVGPTPRKVRWDGAWDRERFFDTCLDVFMQASRPSFDER